MIMLITYDLKQPDKDYSSLYESIKQCGSLWWHYLESVWIVQTEFTPEECCDRIRPSMDENDYLLVVDITNQKKQGWLPSKAWEWLNTHAKSM